MPRVKLTAKGVENLRANGTAQTDYWDALMPGLVLRVGATRKTWFARYRANGTHRRQKLGTFPLMSLAAARDAARDVLVRADAGQDPAAEKAVRRSTDRTFRALADEVLEGRKARTRAVTHSEYERLLKRDVLPVWGDREAGSITRREVVQLVEAVAQRAPTVGNRVLAVVGIVFNDGLRRGFPGLEANPAHLVEPPTVEASRDRYLTPDELKAVWTATADENPLTRAAVRLTFLTAQRIGSILKMKWQDFNGDVWTIAAADFKGNRNHLVPLPAEAVAILDALRDPAPADDVWVFPSRDAAKAPHSIEHGEGDDAHPQADQVAAMDVARRAPHVPDALRARYGRRRARHLRTSRRCRARAQGSDARFLGLHRGPRQVHAGREARRAPSMGCIRRKGGGGMSGPHFYWPEPFWDDDAHQDEVEEARERRDAGEPTYGLREGTNDRRLQQAFLQKYAELYPNVLNSLRDDVLPVFKDRTLGQAKLDVNGQDVGTDYFGQLLRWADHWGLWNNWAIAAAEDTLQHWCAKPLATDWAALPEGDPPPPISPPEWTPSRETLDEYLRRNRRLLEAMAGDLGYRRVPREKALGLEWLVHFQKGGKRNTYTQIARRYKKANGARYTPNAVRRQVEKWKKDIGLRLRTDPHR